MPGDARRCCCCPPCPVACFADQPVAVVTEDVDCLAEIAGTYTWDSYDADDCRFSWRKLNPGYTEVYINLFYHQINCYWSCSIGYDGIRPSIDHYYERPIVGNVPTCIEAVITGVMEVAGSNFCIGKTATVTFG